MQRPRSDPPRSRTLRLPWRRLGLAAAALVLASVGIAFMVWPRDDLPQDPDAVVVLGGSGRERTDLGIALSERYDAVLVLSSSAAGHGEDRGHRCGEEAICLDPVPETTRGEARAVAELVAERGWTHVTVATSRFHTARARLLFRQCLGDRVTVVGAPRDEGLLSDLEDYAEEAVGMAVGMLFQRAC
jgi:uncharacterized SAM-binding protein YcdF (DUF218 family)